MPKVKNSQIRFNMSLPFPPELSVDDLLEKSRKNNTSKPGKIPNCFLIYRICWVEHLKKVNTKLDLPEISNFVALKWKSEKQEVKDYYRKLCVETKRKYNANNKSRVFIYHNQCDSNTAEITRDEIASPLGSVATSDADNPPTGTDFIIPFDVAPSFASTQQQVNQSQYSSFTSDWYSSFDTTSSIANNLDFHQNCSLKETMIDTFNLFIDKITSENYSRYTNLVVSPEELERVKSFLECYCKQVVNEKKNVMINLFSVIDEKLKELKELVSIPDLFIGVKNNNFNNNNSQDNSEFDPIRGIISQDFNIFNGNFEGYNFQQPIQDLLLNPPSTIGYPVDNLSSFSGSQLNNNNYLFNILIERNKFLEERIKAIGGLIIGNK